jgi:imidazolonepropionase-like amidohydrolase
VHPFQIAACGVLLVIPALKAASITIAPPGFLPYPPGLHALTGATVHTMPGVVLTNATLIVSNGVILAAGTDITAPPAARRWDLRGMTVYPGFIEPHLAAPSAQGERAGRASSSNSDEFATATAWDAGPRFFGVPGQEADPGGPGPGSGSPDVTPELRMAARYTPDERPVQALRELGFTAAQVVPGDGIIRGQAAVVMLGGAGPNLSVLRSDAAQCIAIRTSSQAEGGGRRPYPNSLMGVFALLRQTFLDAGYYAADWKHYSEHSSERTRPPYNEALDALQAVTRGQRVLFEPGSVLMLHRAARVADELGLTNRVFLASGREWQRPDLIEDASGPFIVPVDFPALPRLPEDSDWEDVSLDQLRAWDWAPENPAVIRRAGRRLALTTHGLSDRKAFRKNLKAAIERGLSELDALAALTLVPAELCGVADRLGRLEPGKVANLTVVKGSYFDPEAPVRAVWVDGIPHEFPAKPRDDRGDDEGDEEEDTDEGRQDDEERRSERESELNEQRRERIAREPLAGRGVISDPAVILVRNVTLWTCGPEGILTNASLLVRDGKIAEVGSISITPDEATHIIKGGGVHVTPGLIDCHSHSMIVGGVNEATLPSTAMVRIADVVNSETDNIRQQLAGGLTIANLLHGSANPIGGQNCVIKLRDGQGPDGLKLYHAPAGIKFALGENVKQSNSSERRPTRFPQSRMGVQSFYVNRFTAARQYIAARDRAARNPSEAPYRRDLELEALAEILEGSRLIHCHSYRQDEILSFLRTMESFGVRVATLQHILEGYKVADEIARHGAAASAFADWWAYKVEVIDAIPYAGSLMHQRGVNVSFNSDSSDHARRLNLEAAKALKYGGTPPEEALNFVTRNPARQLGIDDRVGSLEPGKDADFVVWSGDPLDSRSVCLQTWIEGKKYFDRAMEHDRVRELAREREALIEKARRFSKRGGDSNAGERARARFFEQAIERARHMGVLDCMDCITTARP